MPELPEVETVCRGLSPLVGKAVHQVLVRHPKLREPIPKDLHDKLLGSTLKKIDRRAKYLIFTFDKGTLIAHLGMSGCFWLFDKEPPTPTKHCHVDFVFNQQLTLRYHDPRRFGLLLYTEQPLNSHPKLMNLGPEPLSRSFTGRYLFAQTRKKNKPIKALLMDNATVVGIGNIYAQESLFLARILPNKKAMQLTELECEQLVRISRKTLKKAITQGGTTLKDFSNQDGRPGYFKQALLVYGRQGQPCLHCKNLLINQIIAGRNTVFCSQCQQ